MFAYIWPIALVVLSNVAYQICAKSVPSALDPFASLTVTYLVGAVISLVLFYAFNRGGNILHQFQALNWSSFILGAAIVGLEVGFIYAYKAGWPVSTASIVQSAFLAVILLFVGVLAYREALTAKKLAGAAICLVGLYFLNT
jgi:drug/metabolite transporter (DMT)-like permease